MYTMIVLLLCGFVFDCMAAKKKMQNDSNNVAGLYSSIGTKLAAVKKAAPDCAAKISSVLDDVDRLYKVTSQALQQDRMVMKELETRSLESSVLQKELLAAKQEGDVLRQTLFEAKNQMVALKKEVDKERLEVQILKDKNFKLVQKIDPAQSMTDPISAEISKLDKQLASREGKNTESQAVPAKKDLSKFGQGVVKKIAQLNAQNLSLTSTSEPSSPR